MTLTTAETLAAQAHEFWEMYLVWNPLQATMLGDRRYDDRMPDLSPEAFALQRADLAELARRVEAVPAEGLSLEDRVTRLQLLNVARDLADERSSGMETWVLDPLEGPQVALLSVPGYHQVRDDEEAEAYLARVRAMGAFVDQHVANLERGFAAGLTACVEPARKVDAQLDALLAQPSGAWALVTEAAAGAPKAFGEPKRAALRAAAGRAIEESLRPAFARLARFVKEKGLPRARPQDRPGVCALPDGAALYGRQLRIHTSLPLTAEQVHATGLAEVSRIDDEMRALGRKLFGSDDLPAIRRRLREDPALHFTTREEVEAKAVSALARAEAAVPKWFGRLPKTPCVVRRIEAHEEEFSTIAYYRQPATDGSRPGNYYINTFAPGTRPRYEAEALAYHEAVPGHHTQIALAQELRGLPEFRKHLGPTAYVEGWALYTERLCDEMGIYSGDLDRMGMLSFEAWRACRLVVDTGMHALGWSRQQAIDFMLDHTALAANNIANEIDRYISWPGQATAYKTGQLEIFRLRAEAERRLGGKFNIRRFHDVVLGHGAVGLVTLGEIVGRLQA